MKYALTLALLVLPFFGFADEPQGAAVPQTTIVSVNAKGADVRGVIHELFTQAKKNYVLQPGVSFALFLSLDKIDFEEALNIVCHQANLKFQIDNGIYFVSKAPAKTTNQTAATEPPKPLGPLPKTVLTKKFSADLKKTEIRGVFAEITKQTGVNIEVDKAVPAYKLDARFDNLSLKGALEKIAKATGLEFKFTDNQSILIFKPEDPSKVSISG